MLFLTGATGTIGRPLLRRLTAADVPVRCLVRDPRRLGAQRVKVQITLGDLADPFSFRNALRGADTVVHLASGIRDQPGGSIEELAGIAAWRLVRAAEEAGVQRFVFFSTLGASTRSPARLMRAKAIAEKALVESTLEYTVFAPSMVYSPSDPFIALLGRMSLLPVMPISGSGRAAFQPIWSEDVADCVIAVLPGARGSRRQRAGGTSSRGRRRLPTRRSWSASCGRCVDGARWSGFRCRRCGAYWGRWSCWAGRPRLPPGTRRSCWRCR